MSGPARLLTIVDAEFALDGGSMMGVVPRALWQKQHPPDARNRIPLVSRFAVVDDPGAGRLWLLDCGLGRDWSPKQLDLYDIRPRGADARALLRDAGFDPDSVTDVVLTHLHFDHAGGLAKRDAAGKLTLAFPAARHHVQASHLAWARSPTAKDAGSFRADHVALLEASGRVNPVDGSASLGGAVAVRALRGHTPGLQLPLVEADGGPYLFLADLVPVWSHLRLPWIMAYDNEPLVTLEEKRALLEEAASRGWVLISEHDPSEAMKTLERATGDIKRAGHGSNAK
ncbi:MAG: MBL fold metallo-hydrolase [Deltaproteobacteria bacterium]|nr:MBL fold metallo-hydrolase [Deltaproteobacteria bacterium]